MLTLVSKSLPCLLTHSLPGLTSSCALITLANFSVSAAPPAIAADKVVVIPMPQLSPHMTSGSVRKWLKQPGEEIATYDVIMEIDTDSLSEEAYKVGDFAGTVTMLVEAQEDGWLSKVLVPEGQEVPINTPVATMCEFEETLHDLKQSADEVDKLVKESSTLRHLTWQSYLKEGKQGNGGCG